MLDGMRKDDPHTKKKLPVEADVPEFLVSLGAEKGASERVRAVGDCALIAFYYLLRVGEYTVKGTRNETKQTEQFRLRDTRFFLNDAKGRLRLLARDAPEEDVMRADGATLRLGNQKNGWKNVCIFQEANGHPRDCPVRALGRRVCHIRSNTSKPDTLLSAYFDGAVRRDVTAEDISKGVKYAASCLDYPGQKNIQIDQADTHSLRGRGGGKALALPGY